MCNDRCSIIESGSENSRGKGAAKDKNRNFTLIELLITIAIIAILAGILLPSLNKARKSALAIKCVSNQKQCGTLIGMYTGDHNGYFLVQVPEAAGWYFKPCHNKQNGGMGYKFGTWGRILANAGYTDERNKTFVCSESQIPHDANEAYFENTYGVNADGWWNGRVHFYNNYQVFGLGNENFKIMNLEKSIPEKMPGTFALLGCVRKKDSVNGLKAKGFGGNHVIWANSSTMRYWAVHNRKTNILFPDLHVASQSVGAMRLTVWSNLQVFYDFETD